MKKFAICISIWAGLASLASAAVCPDGSALSVFDVAGFSCTIGDKSFSNFTYTSSAFGGALKVPDTGVTVDTLGPAGSGASITNADIGLQFNAGWNANAGGTTDSAIGFTVTVVGGGGMLIKDTGLAQVSGVTPDGSASVSEKGCGPAPCTPSTISVMTFDNGTPSSQVVANTIFTPIGSITVSKDISVTGGATGQAHLSVVQDTFSQTAVPEPVSILLLGTTLVCVAGIARKRRARV